jgi:hypothetical protein
LRAGVVSLVLASGLLLGCQRRGVEPARLRLLRVEAPRDGVLWLHFSRDLDPAAFRDISDFQVAGLPLLSVEAPGRDAQRRVVFTGRQLRRAYELLVMDIDDEGESEARASFIGAGPRPVAALRGTTAVDLSGLKALGWRIVDMPGASRGGPSRWSLREGVIRQSSNIAGEAAPAAGSFGRPGTLLLESSTPLEDGLIEATVRCTDDDTFGFVFRYRDDGHHVRAQWDRRAERLSVIEVDGAGAREVASDAAAYPLGRAMRLRFALIGREVSFFVDGRQVLSGVLTAPSRSGESGLYACAHDGLEISDLVVQRARSLAAAPGRDRTGGALDRRTDR